MSSRYFEFRGESGGHVSAKFWEITVVGVSVTTRYGRIGAAGQRTIKDFESPDSAERAAASLIGEKIRKGYIESLPEQASPAPSPRTESPRASGESDVEPGEVHPQSAPEPAENCPACDARYPSASAKFCSECGSPRVSRADAGPPAGDSPAPTDGHLNVGSIAATLRSLRPYRSPAFRLMVASSPHTPGDILTQLALDPAPRISQAARAPRDHSAPSLPASWRRFGRKGADLANNPATPATALVALAESKVGLAARAAIVQRLDCPPEALTALATDCGYAATPEPDSGFLMRLAVACHPNTPAGAWPRLAAMELEPSTPTAVLEELARHPQREVQLRIARHRGLQGAARRALITNPNASVRRAAARHLYLDADPSFIEWAANLQPGAAWSSRFTYRPWDPARQLTATVVAWQHRGLHEVMVALPPAAQIGISRCGDTPDGVWRLREHFNDAQSAITAAQRIAQNPLLILQLGEPRGLAPTIGGETFYDTSIHRERLVSAEEIREAFASLTVRDAVDGLSTTAKPAGGVDLASAQRAAALCRRGTLTAGQHAEVIAAVRAMPARVGYWGPLKAILKAAPSVEIKAAALNRLEPAAGDPEEPGPQNLAWLRYALGRAPSRRTVAFLLREARRELHDLAVAEPDNFVALAGALLREQSHAIDYGRSQLGYYLLYGQLVPGPKPYFHLDNVDGSQWPDIQDRRHDLAPDVWDAHLDAVASIWESTATNSDVLAWAYRVLSDGGQPPATWSDDQIICMLERGPSDLVRIATTLVFDRASLIWAIPWPTLTRLLSKDGLSLEQLLSAHGPISDRLADSDATERKAFLRECLFDAKGRLRFGGPLAFVGWGCLAQRDSDEWFEESLVNARAGLMHPLADLLRASWVEPRASGRLLRWASHGSQASVRDSFWTGAWALDPATVDRPLSQSPSALSFLWACLGESDPDPAPIVGVLERMPTCLTALAPLVAATVVAGLSDHQWSLVVALIGTDQDILQRDTELAVALATRASGWVQSMALQALEQSQQTGQVWLPLLESQTPPAAELALGYVDSIETREELTDAVLAILDSGVPATRQNGMAALGRLRDRLDVDRVYAGLAEHEAGEITELVADQALASGLRDVEALRAFDRRVLLQRGGSRLAKRNVQSRWMSAAAEVEHHPMIDQEVLLILIDQSDVEDQEWAFRMLAELAAQGAELIAGRVRLTSDGVDPWS